MTTPNGSPEWAASQASPEVTVNEAVRRTERGANLYLVIDRDLSAPPGSCADGATYIVGPTATGAWAGHENDIAISVGTNAANGWYFRDPEWGMLAYIRDESPAMHYWDAASSPAAWAVFTA